MSSILLSHSIPISSRKRDSQGRLLPVYKSCKVEGCGKWPKLRGLCWMHYRRLTRYGDVGTVETTRQEVIPKKLREAALAALGNKCHTCGFSDSRALQIDHPRSDGAEHRKRVNWSQRYRDALNNPDKYTLLCANCNWIKRVENKEVKGRPRNG